MIDFRHQTFLTLCQHLHYSKVAEILHLTQPAVTQHIQYLERYYNCKLFSYKNKQLTLTEKGILLEKHLKKIFADCALTKHLMEASSEDIPLDFGATLTIGEYVMPDLLSQFLLENPKTQIKMLVENTQSLLEKLDAGILSFALVEGYFDESKYTSLAFRREPFIAICSSDSKYAEGTYCLRDLIGTPILIRESGSGTREILERILYERNSSIQVFGETIELGNLNVIQALVQKNLGISFMYEAAAKSGLCNGTLKQIQLLDFEVEKSFHFVYLKDSIHESLYLSWFEKINHLDIPLGGIVR